jgi:hypothetical protein
VYGCEFALPKHTAHMREVGGSRPSSPTLRIASSFAGPLWRCENSERNEQHNVKLLRQSDGQLEADAVWHMRIGSGPSPANTTA